MKVILSLSGGMDSTTVLAWLLDQGFQVECCTFTYGSKHNPYENKAAQAVAAYYMVPLFGPVDLSGVTQFFTSNLLQGQGVIPEGHYTDQTMSETVVPGRNIIFASILAGLAWSRGASHVALGIHQGDHAIYADCRKEFFHSMNQSVQLGTDNRVSLLAPFLSTDKIGILKWGLEHYVPYLLTRTCYKDQEKACGKCGACVERLEAFALNNMIDPVEYE